MRQKFIKFAKKLNFISILFFISTVLLLLMAVVVYHSLYQLEKASETYIQKHLLVAARAASTFLTVEELDMFHSREDMERPEWEEIRERLQEFAKDYQVLYVYYWRLYGENQIQYIIDNDEDEEEMVSPELKFDIDEDPATAEAVPFIIAGNVWASDLGVYTTSFDGLISGLAPVYNEDGTVYCAAGVDLSDEIIIAQRNNSRNMMMVLIAALGFSVLSGILSTRSYRRKARQSEQANKAKSQFLAIMSHEIRTPLNAVIGLSEIELQSNLPDKSRNNLQQIYYSGSSLLGIINDILDISKIEAGGYELIPVDYETVTTIGNTVNLNRVRIGSKPINFILEIEDNFPRKLNGDELRVKQILNNLLSNAIKYTNEGSVTLSIGWENRSSKEKKEALIRFTIKDTGRGISKENLPKLFSGYSQFDVKANRKIEGTGLGLEITKKLVEMMGGEIKVHSEYNKGSTFTVTIIQEIVEILGIGNDAGEKLRQLKHTENGLIKEIDYSFMPYGRVLVVDDMPVNLLVAKGLLEPYGLQVDTADSGHEAIEKIFDNEKYDLILMDHMMPGMDGIEALIIIRDWEKKQGIAEVCPIIALTANALVGNAEMFHSKGFNGFIAKPIDVIELDKILTRWIRDKQSHKTIRQAEIQKFSKENGNKIFTPPTIPGINAAKGIPMKGWAEDRYRRIMSAFLKDVMARLPLLQVEPKEESLADLASQFHALKGASSNLGAELAETAARLEAAGKAGDLQTVKNNLPAFAQSLADLIGNIQKALEQKEEKNESPAASAELVSPLKELVNALKSTNTADIDRILEELEKNQLDSKTKEILEKISDETLLGEFETAIKITEELLAVCLNKA